MATGYFAQGRSRFFSSLANQDEIQAFARASVLGISDGLTLIQMTDSDQFLALQALLYDAEKYRTSLDERLANMIIGKLSESLK